MKNLVNLQPILQAVPLHNFRTCELVTAYATSVDIASGCSLSQNEAVSVDETTWLHNIWISIPRSFLGKRVNDVAADIIVHSHK